MHQDAAAQRQGTRTNTLTTTAPHDSPPKDSKITTIYGFPCLAYCATSAAILLDIFV